MVSEGAIAPVILDIRLRDEDFYRERHRIVFRAVKGLYERSEPVDALTVAEYLTQQGELAEAGGKDAVSELASTVPAPGNARHYAQIVKQNSLLRRLLEASQRIQKSVHEREGEPAELVERAESDLFKVAHEERASDFRLRRGGPGGGDRSPRGAGQGRPRGHGDALRVPRPRRAARGIPTREPDRDRRSAIARKVGAGLQHRRERGDEGRIAGRLLLARDVGVRAGPPVHRLPRSDPERPPAQGQGRGARLAAGRARLQRAGEGAAVAGRLLRPQHAGAAGQGPPPDRQPGGPRAGDRRLHAADAGGGPAGQPRRAGRPDQPWPEDPRPRAQACP